MEDLKSAILTRQAVVAVLGQGYVGLPLALNVCRAGYVTYGIDINRERVSHLALGKSHVLDVSDQELANALESGRYRPTNAFDVLQQTDIAIICVPTPLNKTKAPDVSFITSAVAKLKQHAHNGMLIILESTTYPGTTEELIAAELRPLGYHVGEHVFICFSPERVDPGNQVFNTKNTPKVIGGLTPESTELGKLLYEQIMDRVVPVSSAKVAETVKLLENTFRAINIALVNELALMCERMNIDIWEVIDAASTKPFGFMPFYPGPGIGGHCIPLDPMYLAWKARSFDFHNQFIELATETNSNMPRHIFSRIAEALNLEALAIRRARILLLGVAYKKDIDDVRESPSIEIYRLLKTNGAHVDFHDPHVKCFLHEGVLVTGVPLTDESLRSYDCVVLVTNHSIFDYQWIAHRARLILDTRNAFREIVAPHILRLGVPTPTPQEWEHQKESLA